MKKLYHIFEDSTHKFWFKMGLPVITIGVLERFLTEIYQRDGLEEEAACASFHLDLQIWRPATTSYGELAYSEPIIDVDCLEARIRTALLNIPRSMVENAFGNFRDSCNKFFEVNGTIFE